MILYYMFVSIYIYRRKVKIIIMCYFNLTSFYLIKFQTIKSNINIS